MEGVSLMGCAFLIGGCVIGYLTKVCIYILLGILQVNELLYVSCTVYDYIDLAKVSVF